MKRKNLIVVLTVAITLSSSIFSFAAPNIAGTWTGTVMGVKARYGCGSFPVALTLSQCNNSNLVVGKLVIGDLYVDGHSFAIVGRINAKGVTIVISGSDEYNDNDSIDVTLTGKYVAGAPDRIQITKVDWIQIESYDMIYTLYDTFTLTKQ